MKITTRGGARAVVGLLLVATLLTGCEEAVQQEDPPSKAGDPSPRHNATNVSWDAALRWGEVSSATSYRVYFGTDASPDSGEFQREQSGSSFDPEPLEASTIYYWRIDSKNDAGTTTGNVWKFTTASESSTPPKSKPTNPIPQHAALGVSINTDLEWTEAAGATSYVVHFGTDSTPDSNEWKDDRAETKFDPGTLEYDTIYYWRIDSKNDVGTITGDVWRFRTEAEPRPKPEKATNPQPDHNATDVNRRTTLTWNAASGATSYVVYFGTAISPDERQGEQSATTFEPETLEYGTTYCWRVDSKNDGGTTSGDVWCFDTEERPVPKVTNPMPADRATDVDRLQDLSWSAAPGATSYVVYFGTNPAPGAGERKGEQSGTTFDVTLEFGTAYYWRVNSKSGGGTTTGDVWSFTTVAQ